MTILNLKGITFIMPTDTQSEGLPAAIPPIDFAKIIFPSDKITLADIRHVHAKEFDTSGRNFFDSPKLGRRDHDRPQEALSEMLSIERLIARLVFESVRRGKPQASVLNSQWEDDVELIEALSRYYERYGVTHGAQEPLPLIRSIEHQATKQAECLGTSDSRSVTGQLSMDRSQPIPDSLIHLIRGPKPIPETANFKSLRKAQDGSVGARVNSHLDQHACPLSGA